MAANPGSGLLAVWTDIPPELEAEFNEWYDTEHLPQLLGVPGFLSARRYQAVEGAPKYLALYELADETALNGAAFVEVRDRPTPWSRRLVPRFRNLARGVFRQIFSYGAAPRQDADFVLTVRLNSSPARENEFNEWYNTDHIPALAGVPGVLRARRYVAVEGAPKYLALYDLADGAIPGTTAWAQARDSDWTKRIRPDLHDHASVLARRILPK